MFYKVGTLSDSESVIILFGYAWLLRRWESAFIFIEMMTCFQKLLIHSEHPPSFNILAAATSDDNILSLVFDNAIYFKDYYVVGNFILSFFFFLISLGCKYFKMNVRVAEKW